MPRRLIMPEAGQALYARLAAAIEDAIDAGQFRAGEQLPTHRQLAEQFSVSIGSVTRAIDALSARGIIRGEVGRGTYVLERSDALDDGGVIDLTINAPPPVLGLAQLEAASTLANRQALALVHGGYGDVAGSERQRMVLAEWLTQLRTPLNGEEIVLCNGAQQALHLAFAVLGDTSRIILTEGASFPGALAAASNLGMAMSAVAHDEEGMAPAALDAALARTGARVVYVTPVCQNPLGFETGPERRRAIVEVVRRHHAMIVEDDIYGLYAAKGNLTFRDLAPDHTVYITGLSKSLTPLVRVGVIAPPPQLLAAVRRRMRAESWALPPYVAELAVALIESGAAEHALKSLRVEALARVKLAQSILGLASVPMPTGAPHLWLGMPALQAEQLARRASEAGVRITPPTAAQVGDEPVAGVRLCIMAPSTRPVLERALRTIAGILASEEDAVI